MKNNEINLLASINSPADLKKITPEHLPEVCQELRQFIIDAVSVNGGHFGANLGTVELSVALHYVFDTPNDQLIWDVGHQAYSHKILTGRREAFHTNRVMGGISGFPKRSESFYDAFGVGHSSTSISAALGMSVASAYKQENRQHIAVIGDGSMTAGLAFEGMNHAGDIANNILIILNDNGMSIDQNVGGLKEYLTTLRTSSRYQQIKGNVKNLLKKINGLGKTTQSFVHQVESGVKASLMEDANLFEGLNIRYFGPVDGHNVMQLAQILEDLKHIPGPKLLHCLTTKGKGFEIAEKEQTKWHAPGKFDKLTGEIKKSVNPVPQPPKYQDVFGHTLLELAQQNAKIVGVTPAMPTGCSMNIMMKEMPNRVFDVGIAEQHAVTFSAGMATQGLTVFCNIYSSFMQRAYDQVIHDVCLQNLSVIFCLDRAGLAGSDGATHHGAFDLAFMRCVPNMIVAAPMEEKSLRDMMYTASLDTFKTLNQAMTIRYPRGEGMKADWQTPFEEIEIGTGRIIKQGEDLAILSIGHVGNYAVEACQTLEKQGLNIAHFDMRFVKPLDEALLHQVFKRFNKIVTIEDGCLAGGFGTAIAEFMLDNGYSAQIKRLGIPDEFIEHGEQPQLHQLCGFDTQHIVDAAMSLMGKIVFKKIAPNIFFEQKIEMAIAV
jgi:1-deoxy-D-xylulose-5-phosphate synthase